MRTRYFIAAFSTMALISCKQELMPQDNSSAQEVTAPAPTAQTPMQTAQINQQPQQVAIQPVVQQQAPVTVGKGMNPAHGQPGHRCDIAVGAPLNSAPAAKSTTTTVSPGMAVAKEINPGTAVVKQTPTAPGMNPPHGQAGHRCDIAVGAPLSSAPAATASPVPAVLAAPADTPPATETKTE